MGFFSGSQKIQNHELDGRFAYLEEELKLLIFRSKEETLFKGVLARYGGFASKDSQAAQEMRRAARRLAQVASEILWRRGEMAPPPTGASAVAAAWQQAYLAYSEYARAESAVWEAVVKSAKPNSKQLRRLWLKSEDLRSKALERQAKFAKRLKLSNEVADKLIADVTALVAAENWQPEKSIEETQDIETGGER